MADQEALINLLMACTVRVETPNAHGTGFFVAPGLVLTCAHVIQAAAGNAAQLAVYCNDTRQEVPVVEIVACLSQPYPDLALFRIDRQDHPCVSLDPSIKIKAEMFTFGYSEKHAKGDSLTLKYEGPMYLDADQILYKLEEGQVEPGFSGAPLLNFDTGGVCGLIKLTRDPTIDLGGGAVPAETILRELPNLAQLNAEFHRVDARWINAREQTLPPPPTATAVSASLWLTEIDVLYRPEILVGRDDLLSKIEGQLLETRRVLLVGMGGIGKTTLAACLAQRYLQKNKRPVIWLEADAGSTEALIEALANCLGHKAEIMSQTGVAQLNAMRQLMVQVGARLVIVDNVQTGAALSGALPAIPDDMPVLATSRERLGSLHMIEVTDLAPDDSLKMLSNHADQPNLGSKPEAMQLCTLLGFHPLAIKLAGATLKSSSETLTGLYRQIKAAPYLLTAPGGDAPRGHESILAILNPSVRTLDSLAREVFTAFGAFSAPGATRDLLAMYLEKTADEIQASLGELVRRSLVNRQPSTDYYYMHDLIFSYARGCCSEARRDLEHTLATIQKFVTTYHEDVDQIEANLSNILGPAITGETLVCIMSWITINGYPAPQGTGYLEKRGHTIGLLTKLDEAIAVAQGMGPDFTTTLHYLLSKRGNAYCDRRDYEHAIETYQLALDLAPNTTRHAILLAVIGQTFAEQHQDSEAEEYFKQAYQLSKSTKDDYALSYVLELRSAYTGRRGNFREARRFAAEAVRINRRTENPRGLAYSLVNLGSAELELNKPTKALEIHQEALDLSEQVGDLQLKSEVLHALAEDHHHLHHHAQAQEQLAEALKICRQAGDTDHEKRITDFIKKHKYAVPTTPGSKQ